MDQRVNGGQFNLLQSYWLDSGTVEIVLTNDASSSVIADSVKIVLIKDNQDGSSSGKPPTLNLEASPSSGNSPLLVTFESNASHPNGNIVEYRWDFDGNGTVDDITTSNPVEFIYITPGKYDATVEVVDSEGRSASDSATVNVSSPPQPTPGPTPTPTPIPTKASETGVSDVPTVPADSPIKTVCAKGCDYTTIQAAVNASSPGWTIQVKNGIYDEYIYTTKSCTQALPCTIEAYPGHRPILDGTGITSGNGLYIRGSWWIIDGLEIRNFPSDGIKVDHPHITIRNNYIHDLASGVKVQETDDILIDNNILERTIGSGNGHGVYLNGKDTCKGIKNITVSRNVIFDQTASCIAINNIDCNAAGQEVEDFLWENNLCYGAPIGMMLYHNNRNGVIRNNTFVIEDWHSFEGYPKAQAVFAMMHFTGKVTGHQVYNNIFYSTHPKVMGFSGVNDPNATQTRNNFDYNLYSVAYNTWIWQGTGRYDFSTQYRNVTGWETNGQCCKVDPRFIDVTTNHYDITSSSPARNAGTNSECPSHDIDGVIRPQENICDIGMYEFVP